MSFGPEALPLLRRLWAREQRAYCLVMSDDIAQGLETFSHHLATYERAWLIRTTQPARWNLLEHEPPTLLFRVVLDPTGAALLPRVRALATQAFPDAWEDAMRDVSDALREAVDQLHDAET